MVELVKRKQNEYQAFFTNCDIITNYMIDLLDCKNGMTVLEPCAGDGAFIERLLKGNSNLSITALELNANSLDVLRNKFSNYQNVTIHKSDFALSNTTKSFNRIIANPPYGAYQTPEKRNLLKDKYPDIYAKETYGIFLIRAMEELTIGGKLVFIIPDTFLTLHMHEGLRKRLINNYKIESITLFPSNFFPGVNFGYAGLSIISIIKEPAASDWSFPILSGLKAKEDLTALTNKQSNDFLIGQLTYRQIKANSSNSFYLPEAGWVTNILSSSLPTIGSICDVVTGFYSGNDAHYLRRAKHITRNIGKYSEIDTTLINYESFADKPPLEGLTNGKHWVPIVKGGNRRLFKPSEWFMNWSQDAVHDYRVLNKKKARFQNPQFYFKQGVAVPMVSSSSITAALIEARLFDQSIVGIFPKKDFQYLLFYLLGFFNSNVCDQLIRTINASTNNSANYIKKIPIIIPDDGTLTTVNNVVSFLYELAKGAEIVENDLKELNRIFDDIYKEASTTQKLSHFVEPELQLQLEF